MLLFLLLPSVAGSLLSLPAPRPLLAQSGGALQFDGANDYVTFGQAPQLGLSTFTLELWFNWSGGGAPTSTDSSVITSAIPLLTKGRREADGNNKDLNYFLGIQSGRLAVDFEEGATTNPGRNHPLVGVTALQPNVWYHGAATYDGSVLALYLNGTLEAQVTVNRAPRSDSILHAALGSALSSTGAPQGFFAGKLDEARIWNRARSQAEIQAAMNQELTNGNGLVARWGLNDDSGSIALNSLSTGPNGTLLNGPQWVSPGAPFNATVSQPPAPPQLVAPAQGATGVETSPTLAVETGDPNGGNLTVTFYGRPAGGASTAAPFTLVAIPDTQYYAISDSRAAIFHTQTQWIVDRTAALNIVFAAHMGDIVDAGDDVSQWQRSSAAMATLDNAGLPHSVVPGNHDIGASDFATYDQYFPPARYQGKSWYAGFLGDPNDAVNDFGMNRKNKDNYQLFSAGGLDFIILNLEFDVPQYSIDWANAVLARYPDRRAIVVTHAYLDETGVRRVVPYQRRDGQSAEYVWRNLIAPNCNIFLVLNGHYHGEWNRTDPNRCGQPVHQVLQDYQHRANGGNGWLRYFVFEPSENRIEAHTFSPTLNQFETDANSRFTLAYDMGSSAPFQSIGTVTVSAGQTAQVQWPNLTPGVGYEWYAVADDGQMWTPSAVWTFTTGGSNNRPPVAVDDSAATAAGAAVTIAVLSNDSDPDGDALTLSAVSTPAHGTAIANADGAITYTPAADFSGEDSFAYTVSDGRGGSATATVRVTVHAPSSSLLFADGFECSAGQWSGRVNTKAMVFNQSAAYNSPCGMGIAVSSTSPTYVIDRTPANETSYSARFYFNPNAIKMAPGDEHPIFRAYNPDGKAMLTLDFRYTGSRYEVRAGLVKDDARWLFTPWAAISSGWHSLEVNWRAAGSPTLKDGMLALRIDETQTGAGSGVDNDQQRIDWVQLGAVRSIESTTLGAYYFDEFTSSREWPVVAGSAKFAPADLQEEEYNTEEEPSAYPTGHSLFLPNVQQ